MAEPNYERPPAIDPMAKEFDQRASTTAVRIPGFFGHQMVENGSQDLGASKFHQESNT
jgi:hypothetical protein